MSEVLNATLRQTRGKRNARRLRRVGSVPAVLYGHGEQNVSLALVSDEVKSVVRHGARVVDLQGDVNEKAFVRELQWDTFGLEVLHIDLTRVSADERVEVKVPVELRGEAPGLRAGGVVEHLVHEVEIECPVVSIPERLSLSINELQINGELTADHIELPAGASLLSDPAAVIVQCVVPAEVGAEAEVTTEGAEPELIGRKEEESEEE